MLRGQEAVALLEWVEAALGHKVDGQAIGESTNEHTNKHTNKLQLQFTLTFNCL